MKVIDLSAYRNEKLNIILQGQLRGGRDYYEYCLIPNYEMKYEDFKCEGIQIEGVIVNLLEFKKGTIMVSIIFPTNIEISAVIEWLHMHQISFNKKDNGGYYANQADKILEGVQYKGQPIALCTNGTEKIYYDKTEFDEITDTYSRQHCIINTINLDDVDMGNLEDFYEENPDNRLNEKDLNELDNEIQGLDKHDWIDRTYPYPDKQTIEIKEDEEITISPYFRVFENMSKGKHLAVSIAADDPMELQGEDAMDFALSYATEHGYQTFEKTEDIEVYGQNEPCRRVYHFTGEKDDIYASLVQKRKTCTICIGVQNPSIIAKGCYDTQNIGPWSDWHGDLDAKVMVIGQDWGGVSSYGRQLGIVNPENDTNRNIITLIESVGLTEDVPMFFTNAVLCMKEKEGLASKTKKEWYQNCGDQFLYPLINLVNPEIVVALGEKAYSSLRDLYELPKVKFKNAVEQLEPMMLNQSSLLFPMYHCGRKSVNINRNWEMQLKDWNRLKRYI